MSHYMTALAMRQTKLKPAAKIVLYWLCDHYNEETEQCFPSLKTLAKESEMGKSTIVRILDGLEKDGLIARVPRTRENGSQTSTAYSLNLTPVPKRDSPCPKMGQPPVPNRDTHNLGNINLGNEPEAKASDYVTEAFQAFSEMAERNDLPKVQKITPQRKAAMKARLKDAGGLEGWRIAMEKAEASDFLTGRIADRNGGTFKAGIDFLLQQSSFTKLMEGNYDNRQQHHPGNRQLSQGGRRRDPAIDNILRLTGLSQAPGDFGD